MTDELGFNAEPFGGYQEFDEAEIVNDCRSGSRGARWQAAWRFAIALRAQGFLPRRYFIERFCERALAKGLKLDARSFRSEFMTAKHYRQTRPGYSLHIAVVRGLPILYKRSRGRGEPIVLAGVLRSDEPSPWNTLVSTAAGEVHKCHCCSQK